MDVARRDPARIPPEPKGTISQFAIPAGHLPFQIQAAHKPVCGLGAKRPGLEWGLLGSYTCPAPKVRDLTRPRFPHP